jgi:phage FluMu protein Com
MATVTITCSHCGFSKEMAADTVPEGAVRVTCPRCKESFLFESGVSVAATTEPSPVLSPPPGEPRAVPGDESAAHIPPLFSTFPSGPGQSQPTANENKAPSRRELSGLGDLFGKSWEVFKNRIGILLVLYLIIIACVLVPVGLFLGAGFLISLVMPEGRAPLLVGGGITGGIIGLFAAYWGGAALVFAVADETLGIRDSLVKGWERLGSFIWLYSLAGFIIVGGFLLFIVPGVIFYIWFFFGQFVLVAEGDRGMAALLKSKEYVKGRWLDVFFRIFVLWLISVAAGMIPVAGSFLSLLFIPFSMIYHYLIYAELREIRGEVEVPTTGSDKNIWVGVGVLGHLAFFGLLGMALLQHFASS